MKKAIFAGSFNPIHDGHIYIIKQALKMFDTIYVVVAINWQKHNQHSLDKRYLNVKKALINFKNVEVLKLKRGIVAKKAKEMGVTSLIRGIRDKNDAVYEDHIKKMNNRYNKDLKTIYIKSDKKHKNLNSTTIRST